MFEGRSRQLHSNCEMLFLFCQINSVPITYALYNGLYRSEKIWATVFDFIDIVYVSVVLYMDNLSFRILFI